MTVLRTRYYLVKCLNCSYKPNICLCCDDSSIVGNIQLVFLLATVEYTLELRVLDIQSDYVLYSLETSLIQLRREQIDSSTVEGLLLVLQ